MSSTLRFPRETATPAGPSEADQVITLINNSNANLGLGGPGVFTDITSWWLDGRLDEAPYNCVNLEFTADGPFVLGTGLAGVGLFACIGDLTTGQRFLLGTLGMSLGALFPQIVIIAAAPGPGFAQPISLIPAYNGIAIGGITGEVAVADVHLTVKARPFRRRDYMG